MRKVIFLALAAFLCGALQAQTVKDEIYGDLRKAGSNYYAYPGPTSLQTPAPKGKKPCYISHYGRHGSRFLINQREYDYPYYTFLEADTLGKLSDKGREMFRRIALLREEARDRLGELTPLGAIQHQEIARRMFNSFPEVFADGAVVDARSTIVIRCIISMQNALQQLAALNPKLRIKSDASQHDMYYMNLQDPKLYNKKWTPEATKAYADFCKRHENYMDAMDRLYNDTAWAHHNINQFRLGTALFKLASSVQGTEHAKDCDIFSFLFNKEELFENWQQANAFWYVAYGSCPFNGGTQPFSQRNLLRRLIEEADSCLLFDKPGATLRFGHETIVLPLTCLLGVNGFDQQVDDLDKLLERGWINYKVFPMASNLQFVFYRKNPRDKDILLKVLLNENEATLPLPSDLAPYYRWSDFRDYYLKKLDSYNSSNN